MLICDYDLDMAAMKAGVFQPESVMAIYLNTELLA